MPRNKVAYPIGSVLTSVFFNKYDIDRFHKMTVSSQ
jgi:hypothetical protein